MADEQLLKLSFRKFNVLLALAATLFIWVRVRANPYAYISRFRDVIKQNGRASVGTLCMEPLGEIVVRYDNVYKIVCTV